MLKIIGCKKHCKRKNEKNTILHLHFNKSQINADFRLTKTENINGSYNRKIEEIRTTQNLWVPRHKMSLQVKEPPSKEVLEKGRGEFDLSERQVRDAVQLLKDWIELQPHLPKVLVRLAKSL